MKLFHFDIPLNESAMIKALLTGVFVTLLPFAVNAEDKLQLPPSCTQYVKAWMACTRNFIPFAEKMGFPPSQLVELKQQVRDHALENGMKQNLPKVGYDQASRNCASQNMKDKMIPPMEQMVSVMKYKGALTEECINAYAALR